MGIHRFSWPSKKCLYLFYINYFTFMFDNEIISNNTHSLWKEILAHIRRK